MEPVYSIPNVGEEFVPAQQLFESLKDWLGAMPAMELTHSELEERLEVQGREVLRQLYQAHLWRRAREEVRQAEVVDSQGQRRTLVEPSRRRLMTVFGPVQVERLAYRARGLGNLHPADGHLNLPPESHSHGLRRRVAEEASRGSYQEVVGAVKRWSGTPLGKRQAEGLAVAAAQDFDAFYEQQSTAPPQAQPAQPADSPPVFLTLTLDSKGVVMRPEALTEATKKAAQSSQHKLERRLSQGEKRGRKRMATVAAVYDIAPFVRSPKEVMGDLVPVKALGPPRPRPAHKRVWASVEKDAATVTAEVFAEATRRDPRHQRRWVVLVDGDLHQLERIQAAAQQQQVELTIVVDFLHVLEYLWKAAWCFFAQGDPAAQDWVQERAVRILEGKARDVAAGIRRSATRRDLDANRRTGADECADYLLRKQPYLRYDEYLAQGLPIATGVIEGACRYLVKDRMDITGARWGLKGAEAVLRLRSLRASDDWDAYWSFHLQQEQQRHHDSRYADHVLPQVA